jgi:hypothetical protein
MMTSTTNGRRLAPPASPLWYGLYPGMVTLWVADSAGAANRQLMRLGLLAAMNRPAWHIPFSLGRRLRVAGLDPFAKEVPCEPWTADGPAWRLDLEGQRWPGTYWLLCCKGMDLADRAQARALLDWVHAMRIDLVIVEPMEPFFGPRAVAAASPGAYKIASLRSLARRSGASVLAVPNIDPAAARGSALWKGADVCVFAEFMKPRPAEVWGNVTDFCRLTMAKRPDGLAVFGP